MASSVISNTTTTNNTDDILQSLSDDRARQLLPLFVVFVIVFIVGIVGNLLTVYIYWFKFKATRSRAAIVTLAVFDLMSCVVAVPGEAVDLRFSFNYQSDVMCRVLRACATFPSVASGVMLTAVAFDRYRLICTPHRLTSMMARRSARRQVVVVCVLSLMVTWPAALIYGLMTRNTGIDGVMGHECSTSDAVRYTKYPHIYNGFLGLVFVTAFVVIIVCYTLVGRQVYRQGNFRKTFLNMRERNRKNSHSELEASSGTSPDHVIKTESNGCQGPGNGDKPEKKSRSSFFGKTCKTPARQENNSNSELPSSNLERTESQSETHPLASHSVGEHSASSAARREPSSVHSLHVDTVGKVERNGSTIKVRLPNNNTGGMHKDAPSEDQPESSTAEDKNSPLVDGRPISVDERNGETKGTKAFSEDQSAESPIENGNSSLVEGSSTSVEESVKEAKGTDALPEDQAENNTSSTGDKTSSAGLKQQNKAITQRSANEDGEKIRKGASVPSLTMPNRKDVDDHSVFYPPTSTLPSSPTSHQGSSNARNKVNRTPSMLDRLKTRKRSSRNSTSSHNSWRTGKTTAMLGLISLIFVISYLPHLIARVIRALDKDLLKEDDVTSATLVVYNLCVRSYFLNSVANVFVYGVCSNKFRQECRKVFTVKNLFCGRR